MKIREALDKKLGGLHYGNRVLLPFHCYFLKVIVENDIITDFSPSAKGIFVEETPGFTGIYFYDYPSLKDRLSKFEAVKMVVAEKEDDIFDSGKHIKLALYLGEKHKVNIETTDDEILFLE